MINTHPTRCNICGGPVTYGSNARIYGKEYGSGYCYLCERCGAYVGTHMAHDWHRRSMETAYYCAVIGNIHDGEAHEEG